MKRAAVKRQSPAERRVVDETTAAIDVVVSEPEQLPIARSVRRLTLRGRRVA